MAGLKQKATAPTLPMGHLLPDRSLTGHTPGWSLSDLCGGWGWGGGEQEVTEKVAGLKQTIDTLRRA